MIYDLSKDFLKSHFCSLYNFLNDKLCCANSPIEKYKITKALIECKIALATLYNNNECWDKMDELFLKMKEYRNDIEGSNEEINTLEKLYQSSKTYNGEIAK